MRPGARRAAEQDACGRRLAIQAALDAQRKELRASTAKAESGGRPADFPRSFVMRTLLQRPEVVSMALLAVARALRLRRVPSARLLGSAATLAMMMWRTRRGR